MRSIFSVIEKRLIGPHYRLPIAKEDAIFSTGNEGTKLFRENHLSETQTNSSWKLFFFPPTIPGKFHRQLPLIGFSTSNTKELF
jgi:hypothetical protein